MGFKKMESNFSFTDISLFSSLEKNRAIKRMEQISAIINWFRTSLNWNFMYSKSKH